VVWYYEDIYFVGDVILLVLSERSWIYRADELLECATYAIGVWAGVVTWSPRLIIECQPTVIFSNLLTLLRYYLNHM